MRTRIGKLVILDSQLNSLRASAVVVGEELECLLAQGPEDCVPHAVDIDDGESHPSRVYLTNGAAPKKPFGSVIAKRNPTRNQIVWTESEIDYGSVVSSYEVHGKLRTESDWRRLSDVFGIREHFHVANMLMGFTTESGELARAV